AGRGQRVDLGGVGVGVVQRPAPGVDQRLVQAHGELGAAAAIGVAHQDHAIAVPAGDVLVTRQGVGDLGDGLAVVEAAVGAGAAGGAVHVAPEHRAAVDQAGVGRRTQVKALEVQRIVVLG